MLACLGHMQTRVAVCGLVFVAKVWHVVVMMMLGHTYRLRIGKARAWLHRTRIRWVSPRLAQRASNGCRVEPDGRGAMAIERWQPSTLV